MPKILFLGDIVGRPGRNFVVERLASLRQELGADIVIANAENSAGGAGITKKIADQLIAAGVDAVTLGDHVWDQKKFENEIDGLDQVCRPANLPEQNPGRSHLIVEKDGFRLAILTVLGRNYLTLKSSCPFLMADAKLAELDSKCDAVFVEVHMEATSEKIALGWHLDGRAAAVVLLCAWRRGSTAAVPLARTGRHCGGGAGCASMAGRGRPAPAPGRPW